ncbi:MAG: hypothetical protein ACFE94_06685 [Candidatus Hodarchaeota archaeon]
MKIRKSLLLNILILVFLLSISFHSNEYNNRKDSNNLVKNFEIPIQSTSPPNSKPLLINQFATTLNTFFPSSLPTNVHFTLVEGWNSQNVTISYEGISIKKDKVLNGDFPLNYTNWIYACNNPTRFTNNGWQSGGYVEIEISAGSVSKHDQGVHQQNFSIAQPFNDNSLASFSIDYFFDSNVPSPPENLTLYLAIVINGIEVNKTISFSELTKNAWTNTKLIYNPSMYGQILPGNVSIKTGLYALSDLSLTAAQQFIQIDNIKYEIWTMPNKPYLLKALDFHSSLNYTYYNLSYGRGYSFIDVERITNTTTNIEFTIYQNLTNIIDIQIKNISINSYLVKSFNSTFMGVEGSYYSIDLQIGWETNFIISNPLLYSSTLIQIKKPMDWDIVSIYDGFGVNKTESCLGTGIGSKTITIPTEIINQGLWNIEATSIDYITGGNTAVWNGTSYEDSSILMYADLFQIHTTLNDTFPLDDTIVRCTIQYPNGSTFLNETSPASQIVAFGDYTVDQNMIVGEYEVLLEWTNNESSIMRDKIGFERFHFTVWHNTSLKAIKSYFETMVGAPLLVKVNFTDIDIGTYIDFASITYNTSYGTEGYAIYLGSGIYIIDLDTSSLELGDYYVSFNASKDYYQSQEMKDLIEVKIIAEPLALQLPCGILEVEGNSFIKVQVNVTGLNTGSYYWPANISSDWQNYYTINDFNNGTWEFNLSTFNLPTFGIPEFYSITFSSNKTGYGSTTDSITLKINPVPTRAQVNESIIQIHPNHNFNLVVNYTIESSGELIDGANISIIWSSTYNCTPFSNGFLILFNSSGLSVDSYPIYIELSHIGYETAFIVAYVMIIPAETQLLLLNPEPIEIIRGDRVNISCLYVSDGQNLINSSLSLVGDIIGTFKWNGTEFYSTINTQNLESKSYLIQILATNQNFEPQLRDLIITVFPLDINIQISSLTFKFKEGQSNKVDFTVFDESHNCISTEFNVSCEYNGKSQLLHPVSNDSYQLDLNSLNLNPFRSNHQIKIVVSNPYGEDEIIILIVYTSLFETILTISVISIISIAALVTLGVFINKRYLGLSKFQRKIRTVKKKFKNQKFDKIYEPSRENIIKNLINNQYLPSKIPFKDKYRAEFKMKDKK